ncbi:MAG: hypothetical protein KKB50_02830 [Planctomycetes bacterium]|nr:hypothetical protein [Planctomycetota bacterium]
MSNSHKPLCDSRLERDGAIRVLLEEYHALYGLLRFRMETIDRRMPLVAGGLGGLLLGIPALPTISARVALMVLPATVTWAVVATFSHTRAKEDHLRRIAEIEVEVNELAGRQLLVFQSRHPGQGRYVGGRSGRTAALAIATGAFSVLAACGVFFAGSQSSTRILGAYVAYVGVSAGTIAANLLRLRRYRYEKPPPRVILPSGN